MSYPIPEDLRELYEAAQPLQKSGLWMPEACDRACELIERIAKLEADNKALLKALERILSIGAGDFNGCEMECYCGFVEDSNGDLDEKAICAVCQAHAAIKQAKEQK